MTDRIRRVAARWWTYQRERFPLMAHGPLIAVFSLSGLYYSAALHGRSPWPEAGVALAAFLSTLLVFLQLRIADEFKDYADDSRYRPYRAVPRGVVSLAALGRLAYGAAVVQLLLALAWGASLVPLLLGVWGYLALMRVEFFAPEALRRRPLAYLLSHMLILPVVALYVTAYDWGLQGEGPSLQLGWFLLMSFTNGIVIEVGRKLRAPEDEEPGVETYSKRWGRPKAVGAWLVALVLTALAAGMAARQVAFAMPLLLGLGALLAAAVVISGRFLKRPVPARARLFEPVSGVWTLVVYLNFFWVI